MRCQETTSNHAKVIIETVFVVIANNNAARRHDKVKLVKSISDINTHKPSHLYSVSAFKEFIPYCKNKRMNKRMDGRTQHTHAHTNEWKSRYLQTDQYLQVVVNSTLTIELISRTNNNVFIRFLRILSLGKLSFICFYKEQELCVIH